MDEDITLVLRYVSTLFPRVNFTGARTEKLYDSGNPRLLLRRNTRYVGILSMWSIRLQLQRAHFSQLFRTLEFSGILHQTVYKFGTCNQFC